MVKKKIKKEIEEAVHGTITAEIIGTSNPLGSSHSHLLNFPSSTGNTAIIETIEMEQVHELYAIANSNRLRLRLEKRTLDGACFDSVEIENMDIRTVSFTGCLVKDTIFKNVIFQGCNMSESLGISGNTFIDCDMRWGRKPAEFEKNNKFVNTRLV